MVWGKEGSNTLTSSAGVVDVDATGTFIMAMMHDFATGGNTEVELRFDSTGGSAYARRNSSNGGSDNTAVSQASIQGHGATSDDDFHITYTVNIATEEKLMIGFGVNRNSAGAGNAPYREEFVGKYAQTSAKVETQGIIDTSGSGSYDTDTNLSVLGSDVTPAAAVPFPSDVPDYSRFEETDTRKIYTRLPISKTGCLAYYNFEQTTGDLINQATTSNGFPDGLGSSADGTNNGATQTATGKFGNAWSFDGTNDNVTSTIPMNTDGAPYTVVFWYNCNSGGTPFMIGTNTSGNAFLTYHGTNYFSVGKWGTEIISTTSNINEDVWNQLVITNDGTTITAYYNNNSIGTSTDLPVPNNDNAYIGNAASTQYFSGEVDEVSYWDRVLTADEISKLYNSGTGTELTSVSWKEKGTT